MSPLGEAHIGDLPTLYATYSVVLPADLSLGSDSGRPRSIPFSVTGNPVLSEPVILMFNLRNFRERIVLRFRLNGVERQVAYRAEDSERSLHVVLQKAIRPRRNALRIETEVGSGTIGEIIAWYKVN